MQQLPGNDIPQGVWPSVFDRLRIPVAIFRSPTLEHVYSNPAFVADHGDPALVADRHRDAAAELLAATAPVTSPPLSRDGFTFHPLEADGVPYIALIAEAEGDGSDRRDRTRLDRRRSDEERSQLLDLLEESRRLSEALSHVDTVIHASLDVAEVMNGVVHAAAEGMGAETSVISLYQGDGEWEIVSGHGVPDDWQGRRFAEEQMPHFGDVRRTEEPAIVAGPVERSCAGHPDSDGRSLLQPIRLRDQFFGVLSFVMPTGADFTEPQRDYAAKLAGALSLAIENARLYEREHHIAETLQESLLALPNRVNEFDLACAYRSAVEAARVGGDLYDAFETYDGRVCLTVGDISGKGLDAAVLTSLVRNTLRAYAVEPGVTPDEVVSRLNAAVYAQTSTEMFVTLFMALIEPFDGSMAYCNAAHPSPMLRRGDGTVTELPGNSPLVGAFPSVRFETSNATMDDGDILLLYTDGVLESRQGNEMFGEARIAQVAAEEHADIQTMVDRLLAWVAAFSDGTFKDDIAVLVAQRSAKARTRRQRQQRMDLGRAV